MGALKVKLVAVSADQTRKAFGGQTRKSGMRDAVAVLCDEIKSVFADNPGMPQIWAEWSDDNPEDCHGIRWMDLDDDLQDACKREKGGGMAAIVSNVNRNFHDSHGIAARLVKAGDSAESGEIYFTRWTPKAKKSA